MLPGHDDGGRRSPTIACHEHLLGPATAPAPHRRRVPARLGVVLAGGPGVAAAAYGAVAHDRRARASARSGLGWRPEPQRLRRGPGAAAQARPLADRRRRRSAARAPRRAPPGDAAARLPAGPRHRPLGGPAGGWAVETHGLTKRFGPNVAVDHVELLVPRGSAFGYLGPNGAGKTTLIRTLLGLTRADAGTMSLLGIRVPAERSRALARVGAIVDEPRFHHHLTGRENLRLLGAARGGDAAGRIPGSLARVGLERARRRQGRLVLDGHAPAPGGGGVPAGRPRPADPGRADERPRPGGDARDARDDPLAGRRGAHGDALLTPARRGRAHLRRGRDRRPRAGHPAGPDR